MYGLNSLPCFSSKAAPAGTPSLLEAQIWQPELGCQLLVMTLALGHLSVRDETRSGLGAPTLDKHAWTLRVAPNESFEILVHVRRARIAPTWAH